MTIFSNRQRTAVAAGLLAVAALTPSPAIAEPTAVRTLATFLASDEHPEAVAVGRDRTVHVALHAAAALWHRRPDGRVTMTRLPRASGPGAVTRANGIAVEPDGVVSVAVLSTDAALAGVWAGRPGARFRRVAALPADASPNGMSRDTRGNLYIADDAKGVIWRVRPGRRAAEVWLRHPLLDRVPGGTPYGANGTEIRAGELWVGNPSRSLLLSVRLKRDGRPGAPVVRHQGPMFADVDDFDFTHDGALVVARIGAQTVERVRPDGSTTVLADGLSQPTAVAVDGRRVYVMNAAFYRPPGAPPASVQVLRAA